MLHISSLDARISKVNHEECLELLTRNIKQYKCTSRVNMQMGKRNLCLSAHVYEEAQLNMNIRSLRILLALHIITKYLMPSKVLKLWKSCQNQDGYLGRLKTIHTKWKNTKSLSLLRAKACKERYNIDL